MPRKRCSTDQIINHWREAEVLKITLDGHKINEIAEIRRKSSETVRSQV